MVAILLAECLATQWCVQRYLWLLLQARTVDKQGKVLRICAFVVVISLHLEGCRRKDVEGCVKSKVMQAYLDMSMQSNCQ